jgi:hypothetical protein
MVLHTVLRVMRHDGDPPAIPLAARRFAFDQFFPGLKQETKPHCKATLTALPTTFRALAGGTAAMASLTGLRAKFDLEQDPESEAYR